MAEDVKEGPQEQAITVKQTLVCLIYILYLQMYAMIADNEYKPFVFKNASLIIEKNINRICKCTGISKSSEFKLHPKTSINPTSAIIIQSSANHHY